MNTVISHFNKCFKRRNKVNRLHFYLIELAFTIACLLFIVPTQAQIHPVIEWDNTIGGLRREYITDFVAVPGNGYILGGPSDSPLSGDKSEWYIGWYDGADSNDDFWVVKIDSLGIVEWENTIGSSSKDVLNSIVTTPDNGYLLGGISESVPGYDKTAPFYNSSDYWLVKISETGSVLWDKSYSSVEPGLDNLLNVLPTTDGNYILSGYSNGMSGFDKSENPKGGIYTDFWIIKIDESGNIIWENTIGGNKDDFFTDITPCSDGGYLLGGYSWSNAGFDKSENNRDTVAGVLTYDYWVVKINIEGVVIWDKSFGGGGDDKLMDILPLPDSEFLLVGYSSSNSGYEKSSNTKGSSDYWIVKIDSAGNKIWDNTIGGSSADYAKNAIIFDNNKLLIGGNSDSPNNFDKTEDKKGYIDYWVVGLNEFGEQLFDDCIGGPISDNLGKLFQSNQNHIVIAGYSDSDSCEDKSENVIGDENKSDFWLLEMSGYEYIFNSTQVFYCDDQYTLPWGEIVTGSGIFRDTVEGPYLDTIYEVDLLSVVLNDTIVANGYEIITLENDADLYVWFDCNTNEIIATFETPSPLGYYDSDYYGLILYKGECIDTSECVAFEPYPIFNPATNIQVDIYPNPGQERLNINASFEFDNISVVDVLGRTIFSATISRSSEQVVTVPFKAKGMYYITISNDYDIAKGIYYFVGEHQ